LKALAFIRLALADGPLLQTRNIDNPMTLWSTLQQLYEPKGFSAEFLTCKCLFETTLAKSGDIESYINSIRKLTDDLSARGLAIPNKVIAAWTLNNLTSEYENIVATISQSYRANANSNDINLDELFAQLIDESRRLKSRDNSRDINMALTFNTKPNRDNRPKCGYCHKTGHSESKCWKKHPKLRPASLNKANPDMDEAKSDTEADINLYAAEGLQEAI
jgi:hypothetical protein